MKRMPLSLCLVAGVCLLLCEAPAEAGSCGSVSCAVVSAPVYAQPVVIAHQQAVVVTAFPVVFVPAASFTVGLSAPSAAPATEPQKAAAPDAELVAKLDVIVKRLDSIEQKYAQGLPQAPSFLKAEADTAPKHIAVLTQDCQRCHGKTVAEKKGDGIVFDFAALTPEQSRQVVKAVMSGKMPKGKPMSEDRKDLVLAGLVK